MARVFGCHARRRGRAARGIGLAGSLALALIAPALPAAAQPSYVLYYAFEIPPAIPAVQLGDEGAQTSYTGTFQGSLGGLHVRSGTFSYSTGATKVAGGGTFSLTTDAGKIQGGEILMTTDGRHTTLLFLGTYLGTRIEFTLASDTLQLGGTGHVATGLARTQFPSHDRYLQAIEQAAATLPPAARQELMTEANANPQLVRDYQRKESAR